jgi:hypothetical protein|tara:strand:+ start:116 stop:433 length:318 start_codon:yes stop_codon:yes gene_type:complete
MAVIQTLTITDTSGDIHSSVEALIDKLNADVSGLATLNTFLESSEDAGLVTSVASPDTWPDWQGTAATVTRTWTDSKWAEFSALDGLPESDFSDASWTVVSSDDS